ncbi:hypothetical protein KLP40_00050 [Hymenobacter sp. NST-14]|uniref:hypothetical protein n=1 Tax=Hymenobacter piscis TaxID=2839984 RepID=UPI001C014D81|nr:hypothetical protein [Hymenobacter piscis]MBT9391535.1 hypothetical protein [Hymenobacter piscis]
MLIHFTIALTSVLGLSAVTAHGQVSGSALGLTEQQLRETHAKASYLSWRDSLTEKGGKCLIADGRKPGPDGKRSGIMTHYYFLQGHVYKIQSFGTYQNYGWGLQQSYETSPHKENINTWVDVDHHYRYRLAADEQKNTAVLTITDSRTAF